MRRENGCADELIAKCRAGWEERASRMEEAYELALEVTEGPDANAVEWSQRGYFATLIAKPKDAAPSFKKTKELAPNARLPYFAKLNTPKE